MENDIFKIKKESTDPQYQYTYYTLFGQHDKLDDDGNPVSNEEKSGYAYVKSSNNTDSYFIKIGLYGKVFNPIGLYSEGKQNKFLSKIGKNEYNFTKVNKKVFDMYVNFLRTKNLAWLNNAERELS